MSASSRSRTSAASWVTVRMRGAVPGRSITARRRSALAPGDGGLEDLPAHQELEGVIELRIRAELALLHVRGHGLGRGLSRAGGRGRRLRQLPALLLPLPLPL